MYIQETSLQLDSVPAVIYGAPSDRVYLFLHGKLGCKEEGKDFAAIVCPKGWQVLAIDLPEHGERSDPSSLTPWEVIPELRTVMTWAKARWNIVALRANSVGAWFAMGAFSQEPLERALLVSPVLDMPELISAMMGWAGVSEGDLKAQGEIPTDFGETLSWQYLQYARAHPIHTWNVPTAILCPGQDPMTPRATTEAFAQRFGCSLTVMEDGEHWFHTPEQLAVLNEWTERSAP